jgi:hypothetical protein
MEDKEISQLLIKRINTLISIASEIALQNNSVSISDKVHYFLDNGLTPSEIAEILGKPTNYISVLTNRKRKKTTRGKANKGKAN